MIQYNLELTRSELDEADRQDRAEYEEVVRHLNKNRKTIDRFVGDKNQGCA